MMLMAVHSAIPPSTPTEPTMAPANVLTLRRDSFSLVVDVADEEVASLVCAGAA